MRFSNIDIDNRARLRYQGGHWDRSMDSVVVRRLCPVITRSATSETVSHAHFSMFLCQALKKAIAYLLLIFYRSKPGNQNLNTVSVQYRLMRYFTYGSFMDKENLKKHCPSASFICKAMIPNWEVQFNYYSTNYKGGVTGIEPATGKLVRGAVYEIPPDEMEHLDTIEGIPEGIYYRHPILVVSEAGEPMLAHVYRTMNPRGPFKPTALYLKFMIEGARALGLPGEYIETLQRETVD